MANLFDLMRRVNGGTFINLTTVTDVKTNKFLGPKANGVVNPHHGLIRKIRDNVNVMVFQNKSVNGYEAMIHRRLLAEGKEPSSFQLGKRVWGTRLENLPIVEHKGKYYLEVIFLREGPVRYLLNDREIKFEDIQGLASTVTNEFHQGGLDNKVTIRTFEFQSIQKITIDKKQYQFF